MNNDRHFYFGVHKFVLSSPWTVRCKYRPVEQHSMILKMCLVDKVSFPFASFITNNLSIYLSLHTFVWFQVPFDSGRLVFPPVAAFVVAVILYTIFISLFPMAIARSMFAGGLLGYVSYDMMHYYLHHGSPTPGSYLHQLKKYHVSHHFEDQQKGGLKSPFLNYYYVHC